MEQYGTIRIHLDDLLRQSGLSKNKLSHRAEMQRSQINHYCNNTVTRLDVDVLEFVPPEGSGEPEKNR